MVLHLFFLYKGESPVFPFSKLLNIVLSKQVSSFVIVTFPSTCKSPSKIIEGEVIFVKEVELNSRYPEFPSNLILACKIPSLYISNIKELLPAESSKFTLEFPGVSLLVPKVKLLVSSASLEIILIVLPFFLVERVIL